MYGILTVANQGDLTTRSDNCFHCFRRGCKTAKRILDYLGTNGCATSVPGVQSDDILWPRFLTDLISFVDFVVIVA